MRMNLDYVASGDFVLGRDVLCEFDYWPLAVRMPPTKVCPQCNLREKAMKRMRSVESDNVKSARKAKDKLSHALLCRGFGTSVPFISAV